MCPSTLTNRWAVPGRIDAGGACAGQHDLRPGALPAAHGEDDGPRLQFQVAQVFIDGEDLSFGGDIQHHGIHQGLDAEAFDLLNEILGIGRAGHIFTEKFQPEAVVDTLQQDPAQFDIALDDQDIVCTVLFSGNGGSQPAGAAADDDDVIGVFHIRFSTVRWSFSTFFVRR